MSLEWFRSGTDLQYQESSSRGYGAFSFGKFASILAGSALSVSAIRTAIHKVYGDDGGAALTAGVYRPGLCRMLVTKALTIGATICGFVGQIKVTGVTVAVDFLVGVWGYAETIASATVGSRIAGVRGTVDIPTSAVIASGKIACGLLADSIDMSGTHTGKSAAIHIDKPQAGHWDAALSLVTDSGLVDAHAVGSAATKQIIVLVDGSPYAINLYAVGT